MERLDLTDFAREFSTYWGRRRLGMVLDDGHAGTFLRGPANISVTHQHWLRAVDAFPEDAAFRLMGTPRLTPEMVMRRDPSDVRVPPPAAEIGRYAPLPRGEGEIVGAEPTVLPDTQHPPADYRAVVRARLVIPLAVASLVITTVAPWIGAAIAGLAGVFGVFGLIGAHRIALPGAGFRAVIVIGILVSAFAFVLAVLMLVNEGARTGGGVDV